MFRAGVSLALGTRSKVNAAMPGSASPVVEYLDDNVWPLKQLAYRSVAVSLRRWITSLWRVLTTSRLWRFCAIQVRLLHLLSSDDVSNNHLCCNHVSQFNLSPAVKTLLYSFIPYPIGNL